MVTLLTSITCFGFRNLFSNQVTIRLIPVYKLKQLKNSLLLYIWDEKLEPVKHITMKKLILLIISSCLSLAIFAQNPDDVWTKDAKTQLANECLASLNANHAELSDDQKEAIAICYTNSIISAHPKRSEWANLMEIEIKKEKSNTLNQCLKSGGVGAPVAKKEEPKKATYKELLSATWKAAEGVYTFAESGVSLFESGSTKCEGTWALDSKTITITPKKGLFGAGLGPCSKTKTFEITKITEEELILLDVAEKKTVHLAKEK